MYQIFETDINSGAVMIYFLGFIFLACVHTVFFRLFFVLFNFCFGRLSSNNLLARGLVPILLRLAARSAPWLCATGCKDVSSRTSLTFEFAAQDRARAGFTRNARHHGCVQPVARCHAAGVRTNCFLRDDFSQIFMQLSVSPFELEVNARFSLCFQCRSLFVEFIMTSEIISGVDL